MAKPHQQAFILPELHVWTLPWDVLHCDGHQSLKTPPNPFHWFFSLYTIAWFCLGGEWPCIPITTAGLGWVVEDWPCSGSKWTPDAREPSERRQGRSHPGSEGEGGQGSLQHWEDHWAFKFEGLGEPEMLQQAPDVKSFPKMIKKSPPETEEGPVSFWV